MVAKLVGLLIAAGVVSSFPDLRVPAPQTVVTAQESAEGPVRIQMSPDKKKSLKNLLAARVATLAATKQADAEIICGLKVMRVRPNVDPGIHQQIPEAALNATIQRIPQPVCRGETAANQVHTFTTGGVAVELVKPPTR